ncbi:MAG: Fe-S oxidoreductase, partial [Gammaproteobacteria bacterium]
FHETSMKICRPVVNRVVRAEAAWYSSDCPMAGHQIENGMDNAQPPVHPLTLLRMAYGLDG